MTIRETYIQYRNKIEVIIGSATYAIVEFAGETYRYNGVAGYFKIDITDMVRSGLADGCTVTFYDTNGDVVVERVYGFANRGLLPYNAVLQPPYGQQLGLKFLPPSYYILGNNLQVEIDAENYPIEAYIYIYTLGEWISQPLRMDAYTLQIFLAGLGYDDEYIRISMRGQTSPAYVMHGETMKCNREYMFVQWVSRMGNIKRAVWEAENIAEARHDTYDLWNMENGFDAHSGRLEKCTLVLRNLNAYDYWYYSDIVTSTDVWANRDVSTPSFLPNMKVEVTTKEVTQPAGDIPTTLRVNINYRRYDAL